MKPYLLLASVLLVGCGNLNGLPTAPTSEGLSSPPQIIADWQWGGAPCIQAGPDAFEVRVDVNTYDAGGLGVQAFETLVAHSDKAGCVQTFENERYGGLALLSGPRSIAAGDHAVTTFGYMTKQNGCGRDWLVVTVRLGAHDDRHVFDKSVNYRVDCR